MGMFRNFHTQISYFPHFIKHDKDFRITILMGYIVIHLVKYVRIQKTCKPLFLHNFYEILWWYNKIKTAVTSNTRSSVFPYDFLLTSQCTWECTVIRMIQFAAENFRKPNLYCPGLHEVYSTEQILYNFVSIWLYFCLSRVFSGTAVLCWKYLFCASNAFACLLKILMFFTYWRC
jgi:hypothetical protein